MSTLEHPFIQTSREAYMQARRADRRIPALEHIIAKSPKHALFYAALVLQNRFPLGERAIQQSDECDRMYHSYIEFCLCNKVDYTLSVWVKTKILNQEEDDLFPQYPAGMYY